MFGVAIKVTWISAGLLSTALVLLRNYDGQASNYLFVWGSFNSICLFVICLSYASIVVKISCGARPQHHGAVSRERKLTKTLFMVTLLSLLMWLPLFCYCTFPFLFHGRFCFPVYNNTRSVRHCSHCVISCELSCQSRIIHF